MSEHIIHKQVFDIRLARQEDAWPMQQQVRELYEQELLPVIDELFSSLAGSDEVLVIDKLELDLGIIPQVNTNREFLERFTASLNDKLQEVKSKAAHQSSIIPVDATTGTIHRKHKASIGDVFGNDDVQETSRGAYLSESLGYYFRDGSLPWWASEQGETVEDLLDEVLKQEPTSLLHELARSFYDLRVQERVLYQFSEQQERQVFSLVFPQGQLQEFYSITTSLSNQFVLLLSSWKPQHHLRLLQWKMAVQRILGSYQTHTSDRKSTVADVFRLVAEWFGTSLNQLFELTYQQVIHPSKQQPVLQSPEVMALLLDWEKENSSLAATYANGSTLLLNTIQNSVALFGSITSPTHLELAITAIYTTPEKFLLRPVDSELPAQETLRTFLKNRTNPAAQELIEEQQPWLISNTDFPDDLDFQNWEQEQELLHAQQQILETRFEQTDTTTSSRNTKRKTTTLAKSKRDAAKKTVAEKKITAKNTGAKNTVAKKAVAKKDVAKKLVEKNLDEPSHQTSLTKKQAVSKTKQAPKTDSSVAKKSKTVAKESLVEETKTTNTSKQTPAELQEQRRKQQVQKSQEQFPEPLEAKPYTPPPWKTEAPKHDLLVRWGGLVLLAPYLPPFFEGLGLVVNKEFVSEAAQHKAVFLLHYAATKKTKAPEYQLALHKLLCGLSISDALPVSVKITKAEKEEVDALLSAMAEQWTKLRTDDAEALRQGFMERKSILRKQDEAWLLRIERKPIDILLDSLPWGISIIKNVWMPQLIQVEW